MAGVHVLTMTGQINTGEGQSTLCVRRPQVSSPGSPDERLGHVSIGQLCQARVIRHVERFDGWLLETLGTVPGHVLDGDERAVQEKEIVEPAVADDGVISALDDAGKWPQSAGNGLIATGKDIGFAADSVVCFGNVESFLDVGAVEIVVRGSSQGWEAHLVPQVGAEVGDMVEVEARVYVIRGGHDVVPDRTILAGWVRGLGEVLGRRICQGLVEELVVAAFLGTSVDVGDEAVVECEDAGEVVEVTDRGGWIECELAIRGTRSVRRAYSIS